jgi:hypothetical protein
VLLDKRAYGIAALAVLLLTPVFATGPTWIPDVSFKATSLAGWHVLGQAEWRVENGEVVGTAKPGGSGGWLVLDRSYQDVEFYSAFHCTSGCKTGVLLRAEKTAQGMKGIYVSLTEGDVSTYRMTLGPDGQELSREPLRPPGGGGARGGADAGRGGAGARGGAGTEAARGGPDAGRGGAAARGGGGGRSSAPKDLPMAPPRPGLHPGEWNEVEVMIDATTVRTFLNDTSEATQGPVDEEAGRYGPLALYVGGASEVRFKGIAYKDLATRYAPPEKVSPRFRMQRLNEFYYAWSAAVADFNRDGIPDIVAGPYIYYGPDYTKSREIFSSWAHSPSKEYASDCMIQLAYDFTGDGWPDVLCSNLGTPIILYVNPKGEARRWDKFTVVSEGVGCEIWDMKDLDGDGKPEVVFTSRSQGVVYAKPDPANPTAPWIIHTVSGPGYGALHGIGTGDINGDGRPDIVNVFGWWENPGPGGKEPWTYHPVAFGRYNRTGTVGGALMAVYDVNGDGLNDVVTSLGAHDVGMAWYEQKRDPAGKISFVEHIIMKDYSTAAQNAGGVTFSQIHAATFADIDGDGVPDFIAGKRYWSHEDNSHDPDPYGVPVLYLYRTVRDPKAPGGARFVPELIHNHSGGGSNLVAVDLNHDGAIDIITATDRGLFIFWGKPRAATAPAKKAPAK